MNQVSKIPLFKNLTVEEIKSLTLDNSFKSVDFEKDSIIKSRGEKLDHLMVLLFGEVKTQMSDFNGKVIQIEKLKSPTMLAIGFVFQKNNILPVDIITTKKSSVLFIKKQTLIEFSCKKEDFLESLLDHIGSKMNFLSQKLWFTTLKTIKEKILFYLLQLYNQNNQENEFEMPVRIEELSLLFGVTRPSLSRILLALEKEDYFKRDGRNINLNIKKLEEHVYNFV
ncbi:Crp/Fnr family transcriptional regulator [Geotoga petraea]|uniref:Crp/Fnr family transcriptional regulator n=1 Tax=Geotoga petraea TaxID=28234 RepID=A0A4Z0VZI4_9BACT|nr:Crp/Fnr family transcriptional regulator [Geotoga petraea]TGG88216.1 Crp/Fnr family transcriptional regulator [Geotoga petraea]